MDGQARVVGVIKFYNPRKGYGFVSHTQGSDVFFHLSHLRTAFQPTPGHVVTFRLGSNREGLVAEELELTGLDAVDRYDATVVAINDECGEALTSDGFRVAFLRADYVPRPEADLLDLGAEIELNLLVEERTGFRARVLRPRDWLPTAAVVEPTERRHFDDDDENRRLLGVLYKTSSDEEALQAAHTLVERNLRAALSALVARVFDPVLEATTRLRLAEYLPQIYFDEEVRGYLETATEALSADVTAGLVGPLHSTTLLWSPDFPVRWSQYLLPFGLSLLRALASVPAAHDELDSPEASEATEAWLERVWRHVSQQRSGSGHVTTSAFYMLTALWDAGLMRKMVDRALGRLLDGLEPDAWTHQLQYLPEQVEAGFARSLVTALARRPMLLRALLAPEHELHFVAWVESMTTDGVRIHPALLTALLPLLDEKLQSISQARLRDLIEPRLDTAAVLDALDHPELPLEAGWAGLAYARDRGDLFEKLADPVAHTKAMAWARRALPALSLPGAEPRTILAALQMATRLTETNPDLPEPALLLRAVQSAIGQHVAVVDAAALPALLDTWDPPTVAGLASALLARLARGDLDADGRGLVRRRLQCSIAGLEATVDALLDYLEEPSDPLVINALIAQVERLEHNDTNAALTGCSRVLRDLLAEAAINWQAGLISHLEMDAQGQALAFLEDSGLALPARLFADPVDVAPWRWVRLILRRGTALGVLAAAPAGVAESFGLLSGGLTFSATDSLCGVIMDLRGERCYFELSTLVDAVGAPPAAGTLLAFRAVPAPPGAAWAQIAVEARQRLRAADLPALLRAITAASPADETVVAVALGVARGLGAEASEALAAALEDVPAAAALLAETDDEVETA